MKKPLPTRNHSPDARTRSGLTDPPQGALIFPGLLLLEQEVEDVEVAHAVPNEEDTLLVLIVHLLYQCLQVLEVFRLLLCGQERHQLLVSFT